MKTRSGGIPLNCSILMFHETCYIDAITNRRRLFYLIVWKEWHFVQLGEWKMDCAEKESVALTVFFLTVIWLPDGQLWAIIKGQPHSPDVNHLRITYSTRGSPGASYITEIEQYLLIYWKEMGKSKHAVA